MRSTPNRLRRTQDLPTHADNLQQWAHDTSIAYTALANVGSNCPDTSRVRLAAEKVSVALMVLLRELHAEQSGDLPKKVKKPRKRQYVEDITTFDLIRELVDYPPDTEVEISVDMDVDLDDEIVGRRVFGNNMREILYAAPNKVVLLCDHSGTSEGHYFGPVKAAVKGRKERG